MSFVIQPSKVNHSGVEIVEKETPEFKKITGIIAQFPVRFGLKALEVTIHHFVSSSD